MIDSNPDPESLMCRIHEEMVQADLFEIAMISRARIDPTFSTAVDAMIPIAQIREWKIKPVQPAQEEASA